LASIAENPENEHIESAFTDKLFATSSSRVAQIQPFIDQVAEEIVSDEWCLATKNSPITLTPLGVAVNQSGFSPSSCRQIVDCLKGVPGGLNEISLAVYLLTALGDLPEQNDSKFKKLVERDKRIRQAPRARKPSPPKIYLRIEFLPNILEEWLAGKPPIEVFAALPLVVSSDRQPPFSVWLGGTEEVTSWDSEFDKFCDFLRTTIFEFLPSLLRACSLLAAHAGETNTALIDWQGLAEQFQRDSTITSRDDAQ
jgi:helicase